MTKPIRTQKASPTFNVGEACLYLVTGLNYNGLRLARKFEFEFVQLAPSSFLTPNGKITFMC